MRDCPTLSASPRVHRGQTAEALAHLEKIVVDGLRHGFFDCSIACRIVSGGKRQLVIRAASPTSSRSQRMKCRVDAARGDPCDGDARDANHVQVQRHRWDSETGGQWLGTARSRP